MIIKELINGEPGSAQAIIQRVCAEVGRGMYSGVARRAVDRCAMRACELYGDGREAAPPSTSAPQNRCHDSQKGNPA